MEINKKQFNIREVYAITGSLYSNKLVITSMQSQTTLRDASKGIHRVRERSAPDNQIQPLSNCKHYDSTISVSKDNRNGHDHTAKVILRLLAFTYIKREGLV